MKGCRGKSRGGHGAAGDDCGGPRSSGHDPTSGGVLACVEGTWSKGRKKSPQQRL